MAGGPKGQGIVRTPEAVFGEGSDEGWMIHSYTVAATQMCLPRFLKQGQPLHWTETLRGSCSHGSPSSHVFGQRDLSWEFQEVADTAFWASVFSRVAYWFYFLVA